jgi:hypothetical protein
MRSVLRRGFIAALLSAGAAAAVGLWAADRAPGGLPLPAARAAEPPADPKPPAPTHRPLRSHVEPAGPNPTEPLRFDGYPGATPFVVVPRKDQIALYPCSNCHKVLPLNTTPRKLVAAPHVADLPHGKGRLWCLNCHQGKDRDQLVSLRGQNIDFDRADQQCGQCHGDRHRDWHFGAHGKRAEVWRGDRKLYACTHCHDAHNPALQPRAPGPPPPVRAGLMSRLPSAHPPTTVETKP